MGTDYMARKHAKKRRKGGDLEASSMKEAEGRRRNKRNKVRRLCQGMCYKEPALTAEDRQWSDGENAAAGYDSDIAEAAQKEEEQQQKKPKKRLRMTTSVQLPGSPRAAQPAKEEKQRADSDAAPLAALPAEMQRYMQAEGFAQPTPVQQRCWPAILQGRDVRAVAEPGSGKTLAYLLPALPWLLRRRAPDERPGVLILVPTRELAQQVAAACRAARGLFQLRTACIYGGVRKEAQGAELEKQPHIVVATPGRLLDFVGASRLSLGAVGYLVLDEADKMLSLGLQPQLEAIRAAVLTEKKKQRPQVLLFTATLPPDVEQTADAWQSECLTLRVAAAASGARISRSVTQAVQVCAEHKKPRKLLRHLETVREAGRGARNPQRVLVFVNRVKTARFLAATVAGAGFKVALLHGERSQAEREEAMRDFRSGKAQVLVATDVASRGLHIRGLPYIVSYDFPTRLDTYVHHVGRTGRLAAAGHAFSFFTRNLAPLAEPLVALLQERDQMVDPNLERLVDAYKTALAKMAADEAEAAPSSSSRSRSSASDSDSDDDNGAGRFVRADAAAVRMNGGGGPAGAAAGRPQKRRHALPGRIRKKLAKERGRGAA